LRGTIQINGTTTPNPSVPVVQSGAVVSAASFSARAPVAPGSIISIFGQKLSDSVAQGGVPRGTLLNGTLVALGGNALPLIYVSDSQINAIVPFNTPVNTSQQLLIQNNGRQTIPISLPVAPAQPAVFTATGTGSGQGNIFNSSTNVLANPSNPVTAGDTIVIYCAGLGAVDPPVQDGFPASLTTLSSTVNPVTVTIGGQTIAAAFAGLVPGFTAFYQVNATLPAGIATGDTVPLTLSVAGQISPPVTLAVR
jgi:uncharacterized protein (TIGR03437 family)